MGGINPGLLTNGATEDKQDAIISELVDVNEELDIIASTQKDGSQETQIVGTTGTTAEVNDDGQLHTTLYDVDGNAVSLTSQEELLEEILKQLLHLNLQMSFITDTTLGDEDKIIN